MTTNPSRDETRRSVAGWASLLARVAGTAIVFAVIVRQVDLSTVREILRSLPLWFWPAALAMAFVQIAAIACRWHRIAAALGTHLPPILALRAVFVSLAINQCLPSFVGGDAYRVLFARRSGMRLPAAIQSVVLDRISALLALVTMVLVSAPFLLTRIPAGAVRYGFFAVLATGLALLLVVVAGAAVLGPLRRWTTLRHMIELLDQAHRILLGRSAGPAIMTLAVLGHACGSAVLWIAGRALGVGLDIGDCIMIVPWVSLTLTVPLSIAGWGLREGAMVGALSLWGVGKETALALSILLGLVGVLCGLVGLAWWLASGERPLTALREAASDLRREEDGAGRIPS